ncbi:hypothetical protein F2Q68_00018702 [Brassica cretica]|uniref:Uncharacterized protein n=1 Tax=Brassica cretica TaxID=69181 RepID=A0A8S9G8I6_BRACR|nr:hypothetical protein F2Q68_00018702 [Brassica cretica]
MFDSDDWVYKYIGLKRTGKSCRLRWLNYLRPDVRRGNITPEEQLTIMELHAKWGNRWSKIAKHLPGRTDNEIKNFWRTRIQKYIKQTDVTATTTSSVGSHHSSEINDQVATADYSIPMTVDDQTGENYWGMDDIWSSMHLLNGN